MKYHASIIIRLTTAQKEELARLAKEDGRTVSEYIREVLIVRYIKQKEGDSK